MTSAEQSSTATLRQCPHCGKFAAAYRTECPACHERFSKVRVTSAPRDEKKNIVRRGLAYMLLAAGVHYVIGGYGSVRLPFAVSPLVTMYLSPLLFLAGLALVIRGYYLRSIHA
jgi:hypothetical protein